MIKANKTYGFTIAVKELRETVPNMFRYAAAYKRINNISSQGLWEMFLESKPDKKLEEAKKAKEFSHMKPKQQALQREREEAEKTAKAGAPPDVDPEEMEGESYNMCHFWSNFEIARLDFFRSQQYEDFFQMMDRSGGFWNERVSLTTCLLLCSKG